MLLLHMMSFSAFPENRLNLAMRDIGEIGDIGDDIVYRLLLTIILTQIDACRVHISPSSSRWTPTVYTSHSRPQDVYTVGVHLSEGDMCTRWASI